MTDLKETVLYQKEENIAWITFNRPEALNALNTDVNLALIDCLNRAEADQEVRVVILKGSGDKAFVAGADIKEMMSMSAMEARGFALKAKRVTDTIWNLKKPVIAAIQGFCLGGGLEYALACDLRIASEQATFSQSFAQVGLYPDFGATFFLPRLVGLSRASELFYTAERLSAQEALRIGILYGIFPSEQFEEEAAKLGQSLAAGPPIVCRDVKRTMIGEHHKELEDALDEEIRLQTHCFLTEDCAEGLAAFVEKRKPRFCGH